MEYIALYRYQAKNDKPGAYAQESTRAYVYDEMVKETGAIDTRDALIIEDPEQIQLLLNTYETTNINYNDYYYGVVVFKDSFVETGDPSYMDKNYYEEKGIYDYTLQIYFNQGNIPNFLLEYFK